MGGPNTELNVPIKQEVIPATEATSTETNSLTTETAVAPIEEPKSEIDVAGSSEQVETKGFLESVEEVVSEAVAEVKSDVSAIVEVVKELIS